VTKKSEKEELITRYFFGELNEEEQNRVEQEFLTNNQFFEQMLSIEEALIDDYVRGQLPEQQREKVEEFLQSSRRRERETHSVERLIGALAKTRSTDGEELSTIRVERPFKGRSLLLWPGKRFSVALLSLLISIGFGLVIWNIALQRKLSQIEARHAELERNYKELGRQFDSQADNNNKLGQRVEDMRRKSDQIEQEVAAIKESRITISANDTVTLGLTVQAFTRGGAAPPLKVVRIGPGVNWLRIRIDTGEDSLTSYSAKIETFGGRPIWSKDDIRPSRANPGRLAITLPSRLFPVEDYTLTLSRQGRNGSTVIIGDYSFRIKE
jgi:hypothetical protein